MLDKSNKLLEDKIKKLERVVDNLISSNKKNKIAHKRLTVKVSLLNNDINILQRVLSKK